MVLLVTDGKLLLPSLLSCSKLLLVFGYQLKMYCVGNLSTRVYTMHVNLSTRKWRSGVADKSGLCSVNHHVTKCFQLLVKFSWYCFPSGVHLIILLSILLKQDLQFHVMIKMVVLHLHSLIIIYFSINNLLCFACLLSQYETFYLWLLPWLNRKKTYPKII